MQLHTDGIIWNASECFQVFVKCVMLLRKVSNNGCEQPAMISMQRMLSNGNVCQVYSRLQVYNRLYIVRVIKSRRLRWAGLVARMEEGRSAFKILTGKPTGKRTLGRSRRRQDNNIRMELEEIGINAGNWVDSAQDRDYWKALVNAALNLRVP